MVRIPLPLSASGGPQGIFSEVGGWIAYGNEEGISVVNPTPGGTPSGRIQLSERPGEPIAWSSDGSKLLIRREVSAAMRAGTDLDLFVLIADGTQWPTVGSAPHSATSRGSDNSSWKAGGGGRRQIVPPAWIDDTIRGAADGARAFVEGDDPPGYPKGAHYRNCWWVDEPGTPFFHASGINGQNVFVHPPSRTVVAKFSTWPVAWNPNLRRATAQCVLAIAEALTSDRTESV